MQARVKQIRTLLEGTELDYEREKLNERIARLAGGVAIIQVFTPTWMPLDSAIPVDNCEPPHRVLVHLCTKKGGAESDKAADGRAR